MADMVEVENAVRRTWVRELWMQWVPQQQVEVSLIAFLATFSLAMLGSFLAGIFVQQYRQRHSHILSLSELLTFLPVEQSRRAIITTRHGYAFHVRSNCPALRNAHPGNLQRRVACEFCLEYLRVDEPTPTVSRGGVEVRELCVIL